MAALGGLVASLALPKAAGAATTAGPPLDYTRLGGLSAPVYRTTQRDVVRLPMPDGVRIYLEVTRPKVPGRFPVVAELSPYHGTEYGRDGSRILPKDGGLLGFFVPRGYAVLMMDLRGTGRSGGCLDLLGPRDAADVKAVIQWAARQPWSNGRVGVVGHSYPAAAAVMALAQRPRGLATAVVSAGLGSMYEHQFQGGVPYNLQWAGPFAGYPPLTVERDLPPKIGLPLIGSGRGGDDFGDVENARYTGCGFSKTSLDSGPALLTGQYVAWDRVRDWRAAAAANPVPVFVVQGVNDQAARSVALDWFLRRNGRYLSGGRNIDKLWLGQWDHGVGCCPNRRGRQWTAALLAWFDKQLKGRNVATGPPVEVFLSDGTKASAVSGGRTEIYTATRYPLEARPLTLNATPDGGLVPGAARASRVGFRGDPAGAFALLGGGAARFRTDPVRSDLLLIGIPRLRLVVTETGPRADLIANLYDEAPTGDLRRLTQFAINPELREGLDRLEPVVPGRAMVLYPPAWSMAQHLRRGHRLELVVTTSDPDKVPLFAADPDVEVITGRGGTSLLLPVVADPVLYRDTLPL